MNSPEEFERPSPFRAENHRPDPIRIDLAGAPGPPRPVSAPEPVERAVGSPLPTGNSSRSHDPYRNVPPPGRSLSSSEENSSAQRTLSVLGQAMPFVQKLLPLIDSNVASAVINLFAARPHSAPPPPPVDLTPVHKQVSELQMQQSDLRSQVLEQNTSIKRVEDQLEMVREATDRNTLEQQELIEDLKAVGNKVNLFALLLFAMLIVSILLNLAMFLHIKQVLP